MNSEPSSSRLSDSKPSQNACIGGFVAGTALLMLDGLVPIEHVVPGQWIVSSDNQSGRPTHRQVVAIHRQEGQVWLLALKSLSDPLNSTSEPIDSFTAVGVDQAFLTLYGWKRTDELKTGDRLQAADGEESIVVFAKQIRCFQRGHAGWVQESANAWGSGYFIRISRKKLIVEHRDRMPRRNLSIYPENPLRVQLFVIELGSEFGVYCAGPLKFTVALMELPDPITSRSIVWPEPVPTYWADGYVEYWIIPVCAIFLAAVAYSWFWLNERFLSNNLALVWLSGVLGGCGFMLALLWCILVIRLVAVVGVRSILQVVVWCYLALEHVVLYCWRLIGRVSHR